MDLKLEGKVALVTGGGSGIGKKVSLMLAEEGVKVAVVDFQEKGITTAEEIKSNGGEAEFYIADVRKRDQVNEAVESTLEEFGTIDILCNIAGASATAGQLDITQEEWQRQLDTHLTGCFNFTQEVLPSMIENKYGKIVNMGSFCAYGVTGGIPGYCAAKGGIIAYTKNVARAMAENNINVNSVSPGNIITPMTEPWIGEGEQRQKFEETIPLKRVGQPEDVASVFVFLASEAARHITAADINVSGGQLIY